MKILDVKAMKNLIFKKQHKKREDIKNKDTS